MLDEIKGQDSYKSSGSSSSSNNSINATICLIKVNLMKIIYAASAVIIHTEDTNIVFVYL